jgi:methyl-accepting chemotaxis protein I, serine sensor receptor
MFRNLTIRTRLRLAVGVLAALVVLVGILGQIGMRVAVRGLNSVYSVQLPSAIKVGEAEAGIGQVRTTLDRAAMANTPQITQQLVTKANELRLTSNSAWAAFQAMPQNPIRSAHWRQRPVKNG